MAADANGSKIQATVDASGLRTYYEAEGAGPPLVLLHGGACTIETFADLAHRLAVQYRVYLPERRAHGRTPDVDGPITYAAMAQDTIAFLEAVDLASAHVVGWSDGAVVALLVALRRPDLVRGLVLIGQYINPDGMTPDMTVVLQQDQMPDMLPPVMREQYAAVSPDGPAHWDVVVEKLWQMWRTEPTIAMSELATVMAPTLLLNGEHDLVSEEHAAAMQRALPDARLTIVPEGTHGLPLEQPEVVSRLVLDFLGALATR